MIKCHNCNQRDATQPAAETPKPDPAVSLPIITGPLTDVPGDPYRLTGPQPPAAETQTPARDVEPRTALNLPVLVGMLRSWHAGSPLTPEVVWPMTRNFPPWPTK